MLSSSLLLAFGSLSGQMYGYLVGADDRWEYLVAGDPLRQIGEAEPEATQGEVILSPEAWELASTDFVATKTPQVMCVHPLAGGGKTTPVSQLPQLCSVPLFVLRCSLFLQCFGVLLVCPLDSVSLPLVVLRIKANPVPCIGLVVFSRVFYVFFVSLVRSLLLLCLFLPVCLAAFLSLSLSVSRFL